MNMWHDTYDELNAIEREHRDDLTVDQKLRMVQTRALLSISQELSLIQDSGINPNWSSRAE